MNKKLYISVINVIACLGVVILHANGVFWQHPSGFLWISANFLETFFYWSVPLFFMITGATLIDYNKRYSTTAFFQRRIKRTVVPFLFWSIVALFFKTVFYHEAWDINVLHIIDNIVNTRYFPIYWFFMPLFSIYLSIPLLSEVKDKLKTFTYMIYIGIFFISFLPLINNILHISTNTAMVPPIIKGYIIYVLLGYVLDNVNLSRNKRYIIYIFGILGWAIQFWGTLILSNGKVEIDDTFKGYTNFPCLMHSIGIFVFFKYLDYKKVCNKSFKLFCDLIGKLSSVTFGVYLLHLYLILLLPAILNIDTKNLRWRVGGGAFVFAVTALATYFIKKIPMIKYLIP